MKKMYQLFNCPTFGRVIDIILIRIQYFLQADDVKIENLLLTVPFLVGWLTHSPNQKLSFCKFYFSEGHTVFTNENI